MPLVNVKLVEGVFSAEQKQQIVRDLTESMVAIEGENMRPVTWVIVEEVKSGDWGIAGSPLSTADLRALAAGTPVG
jgi:4-oxalocrotonate tautomerase